ncbi:hypothetical protein GE061_016033 [Apolygus lucorum]|uniref:Uncharacterized protein n=1 Tax=Apolygus lucorum TaxID=248454 RepID=A0A8S9XHP7_APOLU|nr:hypothetical protein GE061_016033 [Apolygus lucorum]
MAGLGRGGGRGESLRRLIQGIQPSQQVTGPPVEEPPAPEVPSPPRAIGRGALLSRLTTLLPQVPPASPALQGGGDAAPPQPSGMGRAKLFGLVTPSGPSRKPLEPQALMTPPKERAPSTVGDTSRGAQRTTIHRSSSSDSSETSPGQSLSKLRITSRPDPDELEKPPVIMTGNSGTPMNVAVNYIRLRTQPGKGIFQYDVKFKPEIDSRNLRFGLLKQLVDTIGDTKSLMALFSICPTNSLMK